MVLIYIHIYIYIYIYIYYILYYIYITYIIHFNEYSAHIFKEHAGEILPDGYTWKVVEEGLKIKWCLERLTG
jgi:hypothetical protein